MTSIEPQQFKVIIPMDASSLSHSYCMRHWFLDAVAGYQEKGAADISMHFGSALHKFCEHFYLGGLTDEAQITAQIAAKKYFVDVECYTPRDKDHLNAMYLLRVCGLLADYIRQDKFKIQCDANNKPMTEWKFAIPIDEYDDAVVMLYGTLDKIQALASTGLTLIGDWKSSRQYDADKYFEGYKLNIQLPIYTYAIWWMAKHNAGSIFDDMWRKGVRSYIDLISIPKSKDPVVVRSDLFEFKEEAMLELDHVLRYKSEQLYNTWKMCKGKPYLPQADGRYNGTCKGIYGTCKYFGACQLTNMSDAIQFLNTRFTQKAYEPLSFR